MNASFIVKFVIQLFFKVYNDEKFDMIEMFYDLLYVTKSRYTIIVFLMKSQGFIDFSKDKIIFIIYWIFIKIDLLNCNF